MKRHRGRKRLADLARSKGLRYYPDDVFDLPQRYRQLTLTCEGHDRCFADVLSGPTRWGALACFAMRYETGFAVERADLRWLVCVIETDGEWGRMALRRCQDDGGEQTCWDVAGIPIDRGQASGARWTVTSRPTANGGSTSLPNEVIDWLDTLGRDVCLELSDHLVALQVPLENHLTQVTWLIDMTQEAVQRLVEHAETPGSVEQVDPDCVVANPVVRPVEVGGAHVRL